MRRSSAVCRGSWSPWSSKLALTHNEVKHRGDPLDLGLGRRGRERKRERALERPVGAGELPLRPVRREPVQRPRPDLRLDACRAERGERLVAAVELDDVRLPAVPVALGRTTASARACSSRSVYQPATRSRAASSSSSRASCGIPIAQRTSGSR